MEAKESALNCDLCGSTGKPLAQFPPAHVCNNCGFVFVPERRSPGEIADEWADIYAKKLYDPTWPGVRARLFYVAEWLDRYIGLKGKSVLDIGAGDGFFLSQVQARGGHPVGLEPSGLNAQKIRAQDMFCFTGWAGNGLKLGTYDLVTINWTLENCGDCLEMLRFAADHAPMVSVATGSRILVPFKKPMKDYFGEASPDLHCFRWSANTLAKAAARAEMRFDRINDYKQNDVLLALFASGWPGLDGENDNPLDVHDFFADWEKCEWN